LYVAERRYSEAVRLYRRALPMRDRTLGGDNPKFAESLENYATALRETEDYAEAEKVEVRATRIRVRTALRAEAFAAQP